LTCNSRAAKIDREVRRNRGHERLKDALDANGLKAISTHTGLGELLGDKLKATIELHQTIGAKHVVVPSMPRQYTKDAAGWRRAAELFNDLAENTNGEAARRCKRSTCASRS
jgi:sugar phosphate isomerase/epimerase